MLQKLEYFASKMRASNVQLYAVHKGMRYRHFCSPFGSHSLCLCCPAPPVCCTCFSFAFKCFDAVTHSQVYTAHHLGCSVTYYNFALISFFRLVLPFFSFHLFFFHFSFVFFLWNYCFLNTTIVFFIRYFWRIFIRLAKRIAWSAKL